MNLNGDTALGNLPAMRSLQKAIFNSRLCQTGENHKAGKQSNYAPKSLSILHTVGAASGTSVLVWGARRGLPALPTRYLAGPG